MFILQLQQQSQQSLLLQQHLSSAAALTAFGAITATVGIAVMISGFVSLNHCTLAITTTAITAAYGPQVYPLSYCQQKK
jgi:ABC-type tungstate transport system substrate-binding protein